MPRRCAEPRRAWAAAALRLGVAILPLVGAVPSANCPTDGCQRAGDVSLLQVQQGMVAKRKALDGLYQVVVDTDEGGEAEDLQAAAIKMERQLEDGQARAREWVAVPNPDGGAGADEVAKKPSERETVR